MHRRALLLGVRLGGEDDRGVLGQAFGQHRGVGHDQRGRVHRALPQAAVGLVADGVGPEQVQGGDLAVGGGRADLGGAAARGVSGGVAGTGVGDGAGLAQPAPVGAGGQRQQAGALAPGQPQALGDADERGGGGRADPL